MRPGQQIALIGINNGILVQTQPAMQLTGPDGRPVQQMPITTHCSDFEELVECLSEIIVVESEE